MSFIPDLTARSYSKIDGPIVAVGWLESSHPFPRGTVEPAFVRRLMALIEWPLFAYISFGFYSCSLCRAEWKRGPDARSSQAELLVPTATRVFEAPIWIGHYVLGHRYQPPAEFRQAVMSCPEPGSTEFFRALAVHLPQLSEYARFKDSQLFIPWKAERTLRPGPESGRPG